MKRFEKGFGTVLAVFMAIMTLLISCPTSSGGGGGDNNPAPAPTPVEIPAGYIPEYGTAVQIPVYGGTAADLTNFTDGYNAITTGYKTFLQGKIKEIRIVAVAENNSCTSDGAGKYVLKIKTGTTSNDVKDTITGWKSGGIITQIKSTARDIVRMAFMQSRQQIRS
jgi:hypothetical protein